MGSHHDSRSCIVCSGINLLPTSRASAAASTVSDTNWLGLLLNGMVEVAIAEANPPTAANEWETRR